MEHDATNINFCPGQPEDIAAFLPLIREFYEVDHHDYDEARIRPALDLLLSEPGYGRIWFIEVSGIVAGYVVIAYGFAFESGGRDVLIDELYLKDGYRGRGIGQQTIRFIAQHCRDQGIKMLFLEVENHNSAAFAFYKRVGFTADDSTFMSMIVS